MPHTPSHRQRWLDDLSAKRAAEAQAREESAYAADVVAQWNQRQADRRALWFYPTIGAALAAKLPWLSYVCPACETVSQIDLRTVDRHPDASISSIIHTLKCSRCPGARFSKLGAWRRLRAQILIGHSVATRTSPRKMTTFYVDEAGFTGEDLLAADQPLFVEATNNLTDVEAASIAANIFAGVGLRELKYSRLSRRENHRTRIVELIKVLADDPLRSGVWIAHKEYALVTFIVDRWIEPFAYRTGLNLYKDGGQIALSNMLYMCLQGFWDDKFRRKILLAFQQMFRSRTKERFVECESLIAKHRNKAADQQRDEILSYLHLPFSGLGFSYLENLASHALDLAVPALAIIGHTWRERSSQPLNLIHDQSSNMAKQKWLWEKLSSPEFAPGQFAFPGGTATFPMNVTGTKFEDSANAKQLQFCDILAGATAAYFRARALGASLAGEEYISNLETAGIEKLVIGTIWPTTDISPEALGTKGWDGNIALEWLTGNLAKADSTN